MGQGDSKLTDIDYDNYAYRAVIVLPDSPADEAGIEPQLDFIKYNPLANGNKLFSEYLKEHSGKEVALSVYNII
jgi:hypothetical protein